MAWEAAKLAVAAAVLLAGSFWVSYTAMEALFGGAPAPVPAVPSPSLAAPKGHPSPAVPATTPGRRRVVVPASAGPVTAVPVRSRRPARPVAPAPAWTTPTATQSPPPIPTPTPTPSEPPTATTAPSTAMPTGTPTPPDAITGSGP